MINKYVVQKYSNPFSSELIASIINLENGNIFREDETNSDYQAYSEWVAEGNIALEQIFDTQGSD
jgi:hypothetical protein